MKISSKERYSKLVRETRGHITNLETTCRTKSAALERMWSYQIHFLLSIPVATILFNLFPSATWAAASLWGSLPPGLLPILFSLNNFTLAKYKSNYITSYLKNGGAHLLSRRLRSKSFIMAFHNPAPLDSHFSDHNYPPHSRMPQGKAHQQFMELQTS